MKYHVKTLSTKDLVGIIDETADIALGLSKGHLHLHDPADLAHLLKDNKAWYAVNELRRRGEADGVYKNAVDAMIEHLNKLGI